MNRCRARAGIGVVLLLAGGVAFAQADAGVARMLESPECGPARPGCQLSPAARRQLLRQARLEGLRQAAEAPAAASPASKQAQLPPPTAEEQIQPAYHEHGLVRPEFRGSGEAIR